MPRTAPLPRPRLFSITWPILSEHLLHASVGLFFVWLCARESDGTAAAYGLANQIIGFFIILFRLVAVGASVVVTQYLGAGDRANAERIARAALGATTWLGLGSAALVMLAAGPLLRLLALPEGLLPIALPYLVITGAALAVDALNGTAAAILRAYTHTRDAMEQMVLMYLLSILLGVPFMLGLFGLPVMGLPGIAIGFVASRVLVLALYMRLWKIRLGIVPARADWWRVARGPLGEMAHIGLPGAGENVAYRIAFTWVLAFVAGLGATPLATHTYLLQISYFVLLTGLAVGFGTEIVVGHLIGGGQLHGANRLVSKALAGGILVATALAGAVALMGRPLMSVFSDDPEVVALGAATLWVVFALEPGRTFNLVVINALRATGDVRFPVVFGVFSMFGVAVAGAWWLGVVLGWGLVGVWIAMAADEWVRGLAMYWRWRTLRWTPHARLTRRRVLARRLVTVVEPVEAT